MTTNAHEGKRKRIYVGILPGGRKEIFKAYSGFDRCVYVDYGMAYTKILGAFDSMRLAIIARDYVGLLGNTAAKKAAASQKDSARLQAEYDESRR